MRGISSMIVKKWKTMLVGAVGALVFALGNQAHATLLPPGATVAPDGFGLAPGFAIVADTGDKAYADAAGDAGFVREVVVTGDTNNPFGAANTEYVYQVQVDSGDIGRVT